MNDEDDALADRRRHAVRGDAEVGAHVQPVDPRYLQLRALQARHCQQIVGLIGEQFSAGDIAPRERALCAVPRICSGARASIPPDATEPFGRDSLLSDF